MHDTPDKSEESGSVQPDAGAANLSSEGAVQKADEITAYSGGDPAAEAEAELWQTTQGISAEAEGVVASQLFGMMFATVLTIASMVFVLYFMFFVTQRNEAQEAAENVPESRYVEQRELRAAAQDAYSYYAVSPDAEGRYRIPIDAAMDIVERNASAGITAPSSRVEFNLAWLTLRPAPARQAMGVGARSEGTATPEFDSTITTESANSPIPESTRPSVPTE